MMRESKPSGGYVMNFYRPKYVSCKKTESEAHTRCSRGRGRAQGKGARPPPSWKPRKEIMDLKQQLNKLEEENRIPRSIIAKNITRPPPKKEI